MQSIGILGGSFNPPHIAHLRLALEVQEQLPLPRIDLVPAATPPHKKVGSLLPFSERCRLLCDSVRELPGIRVNDLESRRKGPSYTYDTLGEYKRTEPGKRLFFIMGSEDLVHFPSWYKGVQLTALAHLVIVCRGGLDRLDSNGLVQTLWPGSRMTPSGWRLPENRLDVFFVGMDRLDISSSLVREKWVRGQSIRYLVPEPVENYLGEHRTRVARIWGKGGAINTCTGKNP
ncbi:nicotinate (nicotinamide) nucleotide adenylyltransferase [Desulfoplanes sp.]